MASVRDYVRRRRVIRRRAVFRGERILVKHYFENIITGAKWQDWCEGPRFRTLKLFLFLFLYIYIKNK